MFPYGFIRTPIVTKLSPNNDPGVFGGCPRITWDPAIG